MYLTKGGRYDAKVRYDGVLYHCGSHGTPEEAKEAVAGKIEELSGELS